MDMTVLLRHYQSREWMVCVKESWKGMGAGGRGVRRGCNGIHARQWLKRVSGQTGEYCMRILIVSVRI